MHTTYPFGCDPAHGDDWLLWTYLRRNAARHPGKTAVVHGDARRTYAELAADAEALAGALHAQGVGPGDVVSYQLPNCIEAMLVLLAALRLGAVANPITPIYRRREIEFIVRQARSRILFAPVSYRGCEHVALALELEAPCLGAVVACGGQVPGAVAFDELLRRGRGVPPPALAADPDADAMLAYTSGTVANPKGARHSQRTLVADVLSTAAFTRMTPQDVCFMASPLTHMTGALYISFLPQIHGNTLCMMDGWTPAEGARLIARERCTWTSGATPFLQGLVYDEDVRQHDVSCLRVFRTGGADVPPKLIRDAQAMGIRAHRCYGSTEHPTVSGMLDGDIEKAATTDGKIHPHVELRIIGDDNITVLPAGQVGEIQTRGPDRFLGYHDKALDADAFTADGWFRTGDLGSVDAAGYLTIAGRRKDIIIRKGENISAKEVEDVLMEHSALQNVAVIGLKDEERGEMVVAVCTLHPGAQFDFDIMTRHLRHMGIARQKYPERLEILDELPMTSSGKIRKAALRERFAAR